jgi:hypothetical protein
LAQNVRVELTAPAGGRLQIVGPPTLELVPGQLRREEIWIVLPRAAFHDGQVQGHFRILGGPKNTRELAFTLLGPQ